MHEFSIVQALLDRVTAEARSHHASAVHRVHVCIGELAGIEPELLRSAYTAIREVGICRDAELEIRCVAPRWVCPRCARTLPAGAILRCQECGEPARLAAGDEIILERIEMEVSDV